MSSPVLVKSAARPFGPHLRAVRTSMADFANDHDRCARHPRAVPLRQLVRARAAGLLRGAATGRRARAAAAVTSTRRWPTSSASTSRRSTTQRRPRCSRATPSPKAPSRSRRPTPVTSSADSRRSSATAARSCWAKSSTGSGRRRDIHFKGSGRTPFSRGGDGKAGRRADAARSTRSAKRCTRSASPRRARSRWWPRAKTCIARATLPGAVLTRVAASHIRVGTFQYYAARGDVDARARSSPTTRSRATIPSSRTRRSRYLRAAAQACRERQASLDRPVDERRASSTA